MGSVFVHPSYSRGWLPSPRSHLSKSVNDFVGLLSDGGDVLVVFRARRRPRAQESSEGMTEVKGNEALLLLLHVDFQGSFRRKAV